jgi:uncharacterized protein YaaW (UPF0174 family)
MKMEYREDPDLLPVLESASADELSVLVDVITDGGEGRLALDKEQCTTLWQARQRGSYKQQDLVSLAGAFQGFGGNTVANILRGGKGVAYREVLCDVADHFKAKYESKQDCATIEAAVLMKTLEQSLQGMGDGDRRRVFDELGVHGQGYGPAAIAALIAAVRMGGPQVYKLAAMVSPAAIHFLTGRAVPFLAAATAMRGTAALAGPIGIALTGLWTVFDLASPAYRVTVPCVLQVAYLRQKAMLRTCPACQNLQLVSARYCSDCGHKFEAA